MPTENEIKTKKAFEDFNKTLDKTVKHSYQEEMQGQFKIDIEKDSLTEKAMDKIAYLLDSQFRIPKTNIRFGLDAIVGFIPGAGDMISFFVSGTLITGMLRHGATPWMIFRMIANTFLDTLIGLIPFLGNIFDIFYRSNRRNYEIYRKFLDSDKVNNSWGVFPSLMLAIVFFIIAFIALIYGGVKLFGLIGRLF